jgi:mannose-1-phosphate guanylyltransferase
VRRVFSFREKPDPDTARRYLESGDYAWNSGMFIWRADAILGQLGIHAPDLAAPLDAIRAAVGTPGEAEAVAAAFRSMRRISVDYAVMEPAAARGKVLLVPGNFGWNDVGSWDMMDALHAPDKDGNVLLGDVLALGSRDCVVVSRDRLVSAVDVEGLVIVQTPDAVMVCRRDRAQSVRAIVEALKAAGRTDLL